MDTSALKDDDTSATLFAVFFENFSIESISEMGWYAAQDWMIFVTPALFGIAFIIRSMEEKALLISGKDAKYKEMVVTVLLIALAIGLYFTIASWIIRLFDAIYSTITTDSLSILGARLDSTINELWAKEYQFKLSEIGDSMLAVGALMMYWTTHIILITVMFFLKVGHAAVLSFTLFWGAIALPISVTRGIKMLKPLSTLCIFVMIWPIIEAYFTFVITSVFMVTLDHPSLDPSELNRLTMGKMMFFYMSFAVIQLVLVAAVIAAPLLANSLAMGSGSAIGVVASFAGAGVAAGMQMANIQNKALQGAFKKAKSDGDVQALGKAISNSPLGKNLGEAAVGGVSSLAKGAVNKLTPLRKNSAFSQETTSAGNGTPNEHAPNSMNGSSQSNTKTSGSSGSGMAEPTSKVSSSSPKGTVQNMASDANQPRKATDESSKTTPQQNTRSPRIDGQSNPPINENQEARKPFSKSNPQQDSGEKFNGTEKVSSNVNSPIAQPKELSNRPPVSGMGSGVNNQVSLESENVSPTNDRKLGPSDLGDSSSSTESSKSTGVGSNRGLSVEGDAGSTVKKDSGDLNQHHETSKNRSSPVSGNSNYSLANKPSQKSISTTSSGAGDVKPRLNDDGHSSVTKSSGTREVDDSSLSSRTAQPPSITANDRQNSIESNSSIDSTLDESQPDRNTNRVEESPNEPLGDFISKQDDSSTNKNTELSYDTLNKANSSNLASATSAVIHPQQSGGAPLVNDIEDGSLSRDNDNAQPEPKKKPKKSREEMRRSFFMGKNRKK